MSLFCFLFRAIRKILTFFYFNIIQLFAKLIFLGNGVYYHKSLVVKGIVEIDVHRTASFIIGENCKINSSLVSNPIGRYTPSMFMVREHAFLNIGDNVGLSSVALICHESIRIGNHVKIGGGVCIYDTDFHSLNSKERRNSNLDIKNKKSAAVLIKDNVFIGAHSTILKGVTIGQNSIIGACSVISKNIPDNEIWAGNPARFIKKII